MYISEVFVIVSLTLFLPICLEQFARFVQVFQLSIVSQNLTPGIMASYFLTKLGLVGHLQTHMLW